MSNYLYILDTSTYSIYEHLLSIEEEDQDIEEIFNTLGLNIEDCFWMYSETKQNMITI